MPLNVSVILRRAAQSLLSERKRIDDQLRAIQTALGNDHHQSRQFESPPPCATPSSDECRG